MGQRGRRGAGARRLLAAGAAAVAVAAALAGGARAGNYDEGDEPVWTGLFQAVDADDKDLVRQELAAVDKGSDGKPEVLNMQGPAGQTALMYGCLKGKQNAVGALLDAGADWTITEKDGYGPLHGASFWGQTEVVLELLKRTDIDPLKPHSDGMIPMHRACRGGYIGTVMAFLEAGVPWNHKNTYGDGCYEITESKSIKDLLQGYAAKQRKSKKTNPEEAKAAEL